MIHLKKINGVDIINKRKDTRKLKEYRKGIKDIESKLDDTIGRAEAKLLLYVIIYHFDCFGRQQQLINTYMSLKYHWGNKRTAKVLKTLSDIGAINRSRSEADNWTLFFLVTEFLEDCRGRIILAGLAIKERISNFYSAIFSINHRGKNRVAT